MLKGGRWPPSKRNARQVPADEDSATPSWHVSLFRTHPPKPRLGTKIEPLHFLPAWPFMSTYKRPRPCWISVFFLDKRGMDPCTRYLGPRWAKVGNGAFAWCAASWSNLLIPQVTGSRDLSKKSGQCLLAIRFGGWVVDELDLFASTGPRGGDLIVGRRQRYELVL